MSANPSIAPGAFRRTGSALAARTEDRREGVAGFVETRAPVFRGR